MTKWLFYTGFPSYSLQEAYFNFLGAALHLNLVTAMDAISVTPVQHHFSPKSPRSSPNLRGQTTFIASCYGADILCEEYKVFCAYCCYAHSHGLITFARRDDQTTFSAAGLDNYKKVIEKFNHHVHYSVHHEALTKCSGMSQPSIETQLT